MDFPESLALRHPIYVWDGDVAAAIADGVLTDDERQDILWLCEKLRSTEYFDATIADIQRLHALMADYVRRSDYGG